MQRTRTRPSSALTPQLKTDFHWLLLTCFEKDVVLQQVLEKGLTFRTEQGQKWLWGLEEANGIGDLSGRRRRLDDALEVMARRPACDLEAARAVLLHYRQQRIAAGVPRQIMAQRREWVEERELVTKNARSSLKRLRRFYIGRFAPPFNPDSLPLVQHIDALMDILQNDVSFTRPIEGPFRLAGRGGRPPGPRVSDMLRDLARAGVPPELRNDLLKSTGLNRRKPLV